MQITESLYIERVRPGYQDVCLETRISPDYRGLTVDSIKIDR